MKSKLIRSSKATEAAPTYPALYKSTGSKLVMLAESDTAGTVLEPDCECGIDEWPTRARWASTNEG